MIPSGSGLPPPWPNIKNPELVVGMDETAGSNGGGETWDPDHNGRDLMAKDHLSQKAGGHDTANRRVHEAAKKRVGEIPLRHET